MPRFSRDKGLRIERKIIRIHKDAGLKAERVPLSGQAHHRNQGHDIDVYPRGRDAPLVTEVKGGASLPIQRIKKWLGENDALFLAEDRKPVLVVVPERIWLELLQGKPERRSR